MYLRSEMATLICYFVTIFIMTQPMNSLPGDDHLFLAKVHKYLALCLKTIVDKHFTKEGPVMLSLPCTVDYVNKNNYKVQDSNTRDMFQVFLNYIHKETQRSIRISCSDIESEEFVYDDPFTVQSYIIFAADQEIEDIDNSINEQLTTLKTSRAWNPRARYVIVVTSRIKTDLSEAAVTILEILWKYYKILNAVVLIPRMESHIGSLDVNDFESTSDNNANYEGIGYKDRSAAEKSEVKGSLDQNLNYFIGDVGFNTKSVAEVFNSNVKNTSEYFGANENYSEIIRRFDVNLRRIVPNLEYPKRDFDSNVKNSKREKSLVQNMKYITGDFEQKVNNNDDNVKSSEGFDPSVKDFDITVQSFNIYTWFPYQSQVKCAVVEDVILINKWILESDGYFSEEVALFPNKIPKNLHGCKFRVSAIDIVSLVETHNYTDGSNVIRQEHSGLEVTIAQFVAEYLNLTLVFIPVNGLGVQARVDILSDLEDRSDLTFGAFPLHELVYPFADNTVPYFRDIMSWYVPCGRPVPRMKKVMEIFTVPVWFVFGLTVLLSAIIMNFAAKFTKNSAVMESPSYLKMSNSFLNVWAVVLGVSATEMPRTSKLQVYFFLLVWYCFVMNTLFQTFFTSFLVDPGVLDRMRTLEELYESDLTYHFHIENDNYLKFSFPNYYSKIPLKRKECYVTEYCLFELISSQDSAVIGHSFHTEYFTSGHSSPKLCSLDDDIYSLSFAMHLSKGSPLLKSFNGVIYKVLEGGFVGKWWRDIKIDYWIRLLPKDEFYYEQFMKFNDKGDDYVVLSFSHLQLAFYVQGIGCTVGFVLFVCEILQCRVKKKPGASKSKRRIRKINLSSHRTIDPDLLNT